ncbi:MAG: hypothetical protein HYW27_00670, partial [Candidatus Aenigmarchaeota archaeon]|nr:hypothetical protein [Candidatus Aenigmarchaeota archaeon]
MSQPALHAGLSGRLAGGLHTPDFQFFSESLPFRVVFNLLIKTIHLGEVSLDGGEVSLDDSLG